TKVALALSVVRRGASDAPALRPGAEGACDRGRDRARVGLAARAPPCLCQPSLGAWRRPPHCAAAPRPCRYLADATLQSCLRGAAAAARRGASSARSGAFNQAELGFP